MTGLILLAASASPAPPAAGAGSGLTWQTLFLAVVVAMFLGGFVGNLMASNRHRVPKVSVYAVIEERLREGRDA